MSDEITSGISAECREGSCDLPQYAEGRCHFHFKHMDRPAEGAPNVAVADTPGEKADSPAPKKARKTKKAAEAPAEDAES